MGAAEIAAGQETAGLGYLLEAADLNRRLNRPAVLAHDLARAAGARPADGGAAARARGALAIVEADPGGIALAPEILTRCAQAFERVGDAAAAAYCLRRGRAIFADRLQAIDGDDRAYYLALPWHRALVGPEPFAPNALVPAPGPGPSHKISAPRRATKVQETSPSVR